MWLFPKKQNKFILGRKRKAALAQLLKAFPAECAEDVRIVFFSLISTAEVPRNELAFFFDHITDWQLPSGECITLPYRVLFGDQLRPGTRLTPRQQIIWHCIGSRSHDGYVRQRHIEALLATDLPEWALPYVIKICDEYVIEILRIVYKSLSQRDCTAYKRICALNFDYIKLGHSRMISYWNEYYRWDCYQYSDYVGKKLYRECFGFSKTGQKAIIFKEEEVYAMTRKEFEQKWLSIFAKDIPQKQLEQYVSGRGGHIWHIFSWDLTPKDSYLTGDAARQAYDSLPYHARESAVFIEPFEGKRPETFSLPLDQSDARALDGHVEIFAAAADFSWTYIKTHENDWCGPYFYRKKQ